ncbi:hypothetical protein J7E26_13610 [Bacillus sp. ISL-51]|uniref:hypothetical protein n=1 Tax=Bacteria TaxID=2 RepID=UPI001BE948AC|nr:MULTISPECIES: hypothetical protein [Bacteria]MBT2574979.1 hypothetical protein [Bacillus sp. ISL-51]MBT2634222.1 hypothetical protein [Bacillus sp. ISL-26]MBT2713788.1 hypothetical protein [Pseudomonas sp. ISL-88]
MKKKLAAVTVSILLTSLLIGYFQNGRKLDWIDLLCTLIACVLGIWIMYRMEKRENQQ